MRLRFADPKGINYCLLNNQCNHVIAGIYKLKSQSTSRQQICISC